MFVFFSAIRHPGNSVFPWQTSYFQPRCDGRTLRFTKKAQKGRDAADRPTGYGETSSLRFSSIIRIPAHSGRDPFFLL